MTIPPELIGVLPDLPAADYHALPGASASQLRILWQSTPAHLQAALKTPRETTAAMMLGTLAHSVILEPNKPLPGIVIQPEEYEPGKKWTRAAKVCKDWQAERERAGLLVLKASEYDAVFGMAAVIGAHPLAAALLAAGRSEVSLVTEDTTNRVIVRARLDFVPSVGDALADVKTTADASPRAFGKKAFESGFHIQAALYLALWNALTGEARTGFHFVVVEQTPPHAVNVFVCAPEFLARGRDDLRHTLALYARCVHEDSWPAYPATLQTLTVPKWADQQP